MSIILSSTGINTFAIQFTFGENTQSIATYTLDCALDNQSSEMYMCEETTGIDEDDEECKCTTYGFRNGDTVAAYICFTGSDTNNVSINTFSEFAASILAGKTARLTDKLSYDAATNAIIIIAGETGSKYGGYLDRDYIKLQYSLSGISEQFAANLDHINAQLKLAAQELDKAAL